MACVLRRGDHVPFDAFIPTIRLVAPCRAIPLPARFVSGFGERASVPRLGFGLGRIWVSRVSLPLSIYYSCVYLQYIVIVIVASYMNMLARAALVRRARRACVCALHERLAPRCWTAGLCTRA